MKTLVSINMSVETDGKDFNYHDDTQTHGNSWADVQKGMILLRDELTRQIESGKLCPFHPMNVKREGEPTFKE